MTKYFSQYGQDRFLNEEIFKGKRNGFFVEIGAFDGISLSNTYFFEKELGWKGICVEPAKKAFAELSKNRSCVKENVCISNKTGKEEFLEIDGPDSMLSGLYAKYDNRHKRRILKEKSPEEIQMSVQMNCLTPMDLFERHKVTEIDFCSIDTEGSEIEIIKNIDFSKIKIKYFTIENAYRNKKLSKILRKNGYTLIRKMEYDDIFEFTGKTGYFEKLATELAAFIKKSLLCVKTIKLSEDFRTVKKLLAGKSVRTIIHIGADLSLTTAKYLRLFPGTKIYAFEPKIYLLESFKKNFVSNSLVVPEEFALSDKDSENMCAQRGEIRTKTVDTYAKEQNRNHIDLLKLDAENDIMETLRGSKDMLEKNAIDIISIKITEPETPAGQKPLSDIKLHLSQYKYTLLNLYNRRKFNGNEPVCADVLFVSANLQNPK